MDPKLILKIVEDTNNGMILWLQKLVWKPVTVPGGYLGDRNIPDGTINGILGKCKNNEESAKISHEFHRVAAIH